MVGLIVGLVAGLVAGYWIGIRHMLIRLGNSERKARLARIRNKGED